jgi:hypothetical protein
LSKQPKEKITNFGEPPSNPLPTTQNEEDNVFKEIDINYMTFNTRKVEPLTQVAQTLQDSNNEEFS